MRLKVVLLAALLMSAAAQAADDTGLSDEFLDFLAEWDEEGEAWLDTVGLDENSGKSDECDEGDDSGKCESEE